MSPQEKKAVELLREFKQDVDAAGPLSVGEDWPDLKATYHKARVFLAEYDAHQKEQKRVSRYADACMANYHESTGDPDNTSFDDREWLTVSHVPGERGAWVSSWVWVSDDNVKQWRKDRRLVTKAEAALKGAL